MDGRWELRFCSWHAATRYCCITIDEFCIQIDELCITIDELCIQNDARSECHNAAAARVGGRRDLSHQVDHRCDRFEICIQNDEFCIQNDEICI